jgi:type II secretory pathway component GspD/PulD (secretin)
MRAVRRLLAWAMLSSSLAPGTGWAAPHASALRLSLTVQNAPARSVLLDVSKRFRANVAFPPGFHGVVTLSLHDVTLEQALGAILTPLGYAFSRRGGVIVVENIARASPPEPTIAAQAPLVIPLTFVSPERAAAVLRSLFPEITVRIDSGSSAVIVIASQSDATSIRSVVQALDVRNPRAHTVEAIALRNLDADKTAARLRSLYPNTQFTVASKQSLLVRAAPADLTQIRLLVSTLDAPPTVGTQSGPPSSTEAVKVLQVPPAGLARAIAHQFPRLRVSVSGSAVVLSGSPDDVTKAKAVVTQVDVPAFGSRVTQVYRIRTLDAASVGDLIARSFSDVQVTVDKDLNALSVTGVAATLQRITEAIAQLDGTPNQPGYNPAPGAMTPGITSGSSFEVVSLRSAIPSQGQNGYSGADLASSPVVQTLQQLVPSVRVNALSSPGQIVLIGDPMSLRLAKEFLAKIDLTPPLVVLDTEILEIDESTARNLGLLLSQPVISTSFSELPPIADPTTGQSRLISIGAITRTPLSLTAQLNLQIQRGTARVLADPRITTLSGRTATIRAGDTIGILTTVGGGPGTYTTTQLQNFQTGVTLDITPIVTPDNEVTVALHPVVNSLSGILNGVPQIATRDTQTTVHLKNNQTLIIGGLIQEASTRTENKIPILGDLPLVGSVFRNNQTSSTRNELIIVVTPHVLIDGEPIPPQGPPLPSIPTPRPLPTLPPRMRLPEPAGRLPNPRFSQLVNALASPNPTATPAAHASPTAAAARYPASSASPMPLGNSVIYGQIPANNVAGSADPVSIFFASVSPATLSNGSRVQVRLVSTTNATRATLSLGTLIVTLTEIGPGQWFASFPILNTYVVGQPNAQLTLSASRSDGASATVNLQVRIAP